MEQKLETTFENAKIGDTVWDSGLRLKGKIIEKCDDKLVVLFLYLENDSEVTFLYNLKGSLFGNQYSFKQRLFWAEIEMIAPLRRTSFHKT